MKALLLSVYQYRGFILGSVKRDFQTRYQRSMLGAAWLILQPLSMILVYTLVFSQVMRARLPGDTGVFSYSIYLCSGVLTWGFFSELLGRCKNVFIDNGNLIKKINFPRLCLPIIISFSSLLNFLIIFFLFILFLVVSNNFPGWVFMDFFPVLFVQVILTIGIGLTLGVLNVFFRDVSMVVDVSLQFLFWATPVVYTINIIPEWAVKFVMLNPMARIISGYQAIFVYRKSPDWWALLPVCAMSIIFCLLAAHLYKKHTMDMVDEL